MYSSIRQLLRKYRKNRISSDEMRCLREEVEQISDNDLGDLLADDWVDFNSGYRFGRRRRLLTWQRVAAVAAIAVLSLVIWHQHTLLSHTAGDTVVALSQRLTSEVTLPDGSAIVLRSNSQLTYDASTFARGDRRVQFTGEGYFDIHSDASHPFTIAAPGFEAVVKGTSFNLYGNPSDSIAELALVSGVVELRTATGQSTTLRPNQKALINRNTGVLTIKPCGDKAEVASWQRDEIQLDGVDARELERTFRRYYDTTVTIDCDSATTFTGTLPISSMPVALKVVQLAMGGRVTARP